MLCGKRPREGERKAKLHKERHANSKRQKRAPSRKKFVIPVCRMKAIRGRKKTLAGLESIELTQKGLQKCEALQD
jgi:hypothetical protein